MSIVKINLAAAQYHPVSFKHNVNNNFGKTSENLQQDFLDNKKTKVALKVALCCSPPLLVLYALGRKGLLGSNIQKMLVPNLEIKKFLAFINKKDATRVSGTQWQKVVEIYSPKNSGWIFDSFSYIKKDRSCNLILKKEGKTTNQYEHIHVKQGQKTQEIIDRFKQIFANDDLPGKAKSE